MAHWRHIISSLEEFLSFFHGGDDRRFDALPRSGSGQCIRSHLQARTYSLMNNSLQDSDTCAQQKRMDCAPHAIPVLNSHMAMHGHVLRVNMCHLTYADYKRHPRLTSTSLLLR
jgi:hypothetical protein